VLADLERSSEDDVRQEIHGDIYADHIGSGDSAID
jgi:hypothetical protein